MGNTSETITYPDISPTVAWELTAFASAIGRADGTWTAALDTLARAQNETQAMVSQVQANSRGQFVTALVNLWGGSTAGEAPGVTTDGSLAAGLISTIQLTLRMLQTTSSEQLPAIIDGLNAIAQAQAGPATECTVGGGDVQWSPDQAAALQQRINGLTDALETLNRFFLDATGKLAQAAADPALTACASGITPGDIISTRRIFQVDGDGTAVPFYYSPDLDSLGGTQERLPDNAGNGSKGGGNGGGHEGGDEDGNEETPNEENENPRMHSLKNTLKTVGRWIDGDKNAAWWQELLGKFIVGTGIETAKVGGSSINDWIRTGHLAWHWSWVDWGIAVTATSLGYQAKVIFGWKFPKDKWGQLAIAFLLDDLADPIIHRLIDQDPNSGAPAPSGPSQSHTP